MENGVRQITSDMVAVPLALWQTMERIVDSYEEINNRLDLLESVTVTNSEYMNRKDAMLFLHVGSTKLWELTRSGEIETNGKTGKPLYKTSSCRQYLIGQGFSKEFVQERFRDILREKQKK
ncbi:MULTISPECIES: hypothetical protein [unclassified Spirosoma]|uniref:hypothetical protein n=1 Tax=unclassified Spirosoma TaxID=2621999 RepID=UPI001AC1AC1B|nr:MULTISPECIES: hypothetical protein [unclassified Spirosoma]MBN8824408.1 hypothetical protein [Spirosoma sp.]